MQRSWKQTCSLLVAAASIGLSDNACATSVVISRIGDGVVCNGWAVDPDLVATTAHCILRPGHYSVSTGKTKYEALRSWIHPLYSTEVFFHSALGTEEFNPDLGLLRIIQKDFKAGGEKIDQSNGRALPRASILYAIRPLVPDGANPSRQQIEEIEYDNIQIRNHGMLISNAGKPYPICQEDFGTPLYAGPANQRSIVGLIVENRRQYKGYSAALCGNELHAVTASVVLKFVDFVRAHGERNLP